MKIINRKEFLQMPAGTIYSRFTPCIFEGLEIKTNDPEDNCGNDWIFVPLVGGFIDEIPENKYVYDFNPEEFKFDLECTTRDGMYEEEQLFAIYDKGDIQDLIKKLQECV